MMDELELAGIDANQTEQVASLAAMQDRIELEQRMRATGTAATQNALILINQQAEVYSQTSMRGGEVIPSNIVDEKVLEAMKRASENPDDPNYYLMPFYADPAGASNGEFTDLETGQVY